MIESGTEFRKLAAIMFTDMVGYSAMAQRNEALALELLEEHRAIVRRILPRFRGEEIKTMGDAFLVEFPSALAAVRCAIQIQTEMAERNARALEDRPILLRIGVHLGDIIRRENDVVGDGVNIAARIEPMAKPGGICISEDVARQIQNKINNSLVRIGPGELKNIQLPVIIYTLDPKSDGAAKSGFAASSLAPPSLWENLRHMVPIARLAVLLAILIIALVAGAAVWGNRSRPVGASLIVLPFANLSSSKEDENFSDGLTDELISSLAHAPGLKVHSRATSYSYKGKNQSAAAVAKALQVRHILEGSVRRAGDRVRVTVELVKAEDGYQVWTDTFEESITNNFAFQTQIADRVRQRIQDLVSPEESLGGISAMRADLDR